MPRTLPWLKDAKAPPRTAPTTITKTKLAKPNPAIITVTKDTPNDILKRRPAVTAPTDTQDDDLANIGFMTPEDDQWIMVEDEFLSTAQLFTRSMHRKEYERLRLEAASKNASQISSIQRPVATSALSKETLRRREIVAKERLLLHREAPNNPQAEDSSDGEDALDPRNPWATSELRTLMRANTGSETSLGALLHHRHVATRAAAGYTDSQVTHCQRGEIPSRSRPGKRIPLPSLVTDIKSIVKPSPPLQKDPVEPATFTEDEDDDLDARAASNCKPSAKPMPPALAPNMIATKTQMLDLDDDVFSLVAKPSATKFKGKSMAARERALKKEQTGTPRGGDFFDTLRSL